MDPALAQQRKHRDSLAKIDLNEMQYMKLLLHSVEKNY